MRPYIIEFGDSGIPAFFFMVMIAALVATFVGVRFAKKEGLSEVAILDMGIVAVIASIIGSRVFHILVEAPMYYWEDPVRVFYFWQGGFVSLGAFTGSIIGWIIYFKVKKLSVRRYLDLGALCAPVIIFFVRIGCLLTGCCYGKPTDFPLHLVFTNPASTAYYYYPNVPLHASQIYNMLNAIIMFAVLYAVYKKRKFYGQVGAAFLIYYGVSRFLIEFLRGDEDRGIYFGGIVSTGQLVMTISLVAGIIMYMVLKKYAKKLGE